jgi:hypothetical protein
MMAWPFKGIINLDSRDSVPDWGPYAQPKAPDGALNVLYIVWDDVGFGALEIFGGMIETLNLPRPQPAAPRDRYVYYPECSEVPEAVAVNVRGRS